MDKDFDLDRFVAAQDPVYSDVLAELRTGHKHTHWMWFVFPQIEGLGSSEMSRKYAIRSSDEAAAYLAHLLRRRVRSGDHGPALGRQELKSIRSGIRGGCQR